MNEADKQTAAGDAQESTYFPCFKKGPCPFETPCIAAGGTTDAGRVPPPPRGQQPDPETEIASGLVDLRAICCIFKGLAAGDSESMDEVGSSAIEGLADRADDATERVFNAFERYQWAERDAARAMRS